MKTTLGKLVEAEAALARLAEQSVSVKMAYHLTKLKQFVNVETQIFHDQRNQLLKQLGIEREVTVVEKMQGLHGSVYEINKEHRDEFQTKIVELSTIPVVVDDRWLLTLTLLENYRVSADDLAALGTLVIEE